MVILYIGFLFGILILLMGCRVFESRVTTSLIHGLDVGIPDQGALGLALHHVLQPPQVRGVGAGEVCECLYCRQDPGEQAQVR